LVRRITFVLLALCLPTALSRVYALDADRSLRQYVHRVWQGQDGPVQSTISRIWQTRDGYIWLGTMTGAVRFDGINFTPVERLYPGLPENLWVHDGFEDQQGAIWLATHDAGIFRLRRDEVTRYTTAQHLPSNSVNCLIPGKDGDLWACTGDGLARIVSGKITSYGVSEHVGGIWDACQSDDGIWVARAAGSPMLWTGAEWRSITLRGEHAESGVRAVACTKDAVWFGTPNGLTRVSGEVQRHYTPADGLTDSNILTLRVTQDGSLFIGTRNGISRFRNGRFENFRTSDGLTQSHVLSFLEDREGSLWVGTKQGLDQFLNGRALRYTTSDGLPTNNTGPVLEDAAGRMWIGTEAGLASRRGRGFQTLTTKQGLRSNSVVALAEDKDSLWVGTAQGVSQLSGDRIVRSFGRGEGLPDEHVASLYVDRRGHLWAGTSAGVAFLDGDRFVAVAGIAAGEVQALTEDSHGAIIAGTERAAYRIRNGWASAIVPRGEPLRNVVSLLRDPDGLVWMGTGGFGIRLLDKTGKLTAFHVRDGLFDAEIYGFALDDYGRLWISSGKGVFWLSREELLQYAAGKIKRVRSTPYASRDALPSVEGRTGVQPSAWKARDGRIWLPTARGLVVIDQRRAHLKRPTPPVVIEDPVVNGRRTDASRIRRLPPGSNNLQFRYAALSYIAPNAIRFKYLLEGYDSQWTDASARREAFYTNLPPGNFRFRVTACDDEGACDANGTAVEFSLAPHLYQRGWFPALMTCLAALMVFGTWQFRMRYMQQRYRVILAERSRIARELHDTLVQGFSGVTMALQALAGRLPSSDERRILEEIIDDAAHCLRDTRHSVAGLRGARVTGSALGAAVSKAAGQITETENVRLRLRVGDTLPALEPETEYNLLQIASEAVTNAVKHARAATIEVQLRHAGDALKLSVHDDGAGFDLPGAAAREGHYGLIGMRERAAQVGGAFQILSRPGEGTTVSVEVAISDRRDAGGLLNREHHREPHTGHLR
jgi:signal transduction histidine kinase/ligand-binding sensor domain-containing protein